MMLVFFGGGACHIASQTVSILVWYNSHSTMSQEGPDQLVEWIISTVAKTFGGFSKQELFHPIESFAREESCWFIIIYVDKDDEEFVATSSPDTVQSGALCLYYAKKGGASRPLSWPKPSDIIYGTFVASSDDIPSILQVDRGGVRAEPEAVSPLGDISNITSVRLPLPPVSSTNHCVSFEPVEMETYLGQWFDTIKVVLDGLNDVASDTGGPLDVYLFWKRKSEILGKIYYQLQGTKIRHILRCLDRCHTKKRYAFIQLCRRMHTEREEATSNELHLRPIVPYLEGLQSEKNFLRMPCYFVPSLHLLCFICAKSAYLNRTPSVVRLLRSICSALVKSSSTHVSCALPFISKSPSEARAIVSKLKEAITLLGRFKSRYAICKKQLAWDECIADPFILGRVNTVLDFCHEAIEVYRVSSQYSSLQSVIFGGRRGRILTAACQDVCRDFKRVLGKLSGSIGDVDPSQVGAAAFKDTFYTFKVAVRRLDYRLQSLATHCIADCIRLDDKLRLMALFGSIANRDQDQMLISSSVMDEAFAHFTCEIKVLSRRFENGFARSSLSLYMPASASASILWCRSLLERARHSMDLLQQVDARFARGPIYQELVESYVKLEGQLVEYEWQQTVTYEKELNAFASTRTSTVELEARAPVLRRIRRTAKDGSYSFDHFRMNIVPALDRIVFESKMAHRLGIGLPGGFVVAARRIQALRVIRSRLKIVVDEFNRVNLNISEQDRTLVQNQITSLSDALFEGACSTCWESDILESFCNRAESVLLELLASHANVLTNKFAVNNLLAQIEGMLFFVQPPSSTTEVGPASVLFTVKEVYASAIESATAAVRQFEGIVEGFEDSVHSSFQRKVEAALLIATERSLDELEQYLRKTTQSSDDKSEWKLYVKNWVSKILRSSSACSNQSYTSTSVILLSSPRILALMTSIEHTLQN